MEKDHGDVKPSAVGLPGVKMKREITSRSVIVISKGHSPSASAIFPSLANLLANARLHKEFTKSSSGGKFPGPVQPPPG